MDLAKFDQVKTLLRHYNDSDAPLISDMISSVSAEIELYLDRQVTVEAGIQETLTAVLGQYQFFLKAYPITVINSIWNSTTRVFDAAHLIDPNSYTFDGDTGVVTIDRLFVFPGVNAVRIDYDGGMAADTTSLITAFPALNSACIKEVVARYRKIGDEALITAASAGGNVTFITRNSEFMPEVQAILDRFRGSL